MPDSANQNKLSKNETTSEIAVAAATSGTEAAPRACSNSRGLFCLPLFVSLRNVT